MELNEVKKKTWIIAMLKMFIKSIKVKKNKTEEEEKGFVLRNAEEMV